MTARLISAGWIAACVCAFAGADLACAAPAPGIPPGVRRIVFLGDSITYDGRYVADVEAWLATQPRGRELEVINAGLPSETVSGLSEEGHAGGQFARPVLGERLARVLAATKPDLVFACYGINDGIYKPLDAERFQAFRDGMNRLHAAVAAAGARIIHLTPPVYDPVPLRPRKTGAGAETAAEWNYNDVLDTYSDWLLSRRADGWEVVDLHGPLNRYLAERRRTEPAFTMARDGVHPGDEGHWLMAREILKHLGAGKAAEAPDAAALLAGRKGGPEAFKLVQQRMGLLRDAWLTQTGHKRPGMSKGQPLEQAQERAGELGRRIGALLTE